jgi:hypothetical protein
MFMDAPLQRRMNLRNGNRARIGFGTASLRAGGLLKNPFPVIARAIHGVATVKIARWWRNALRFGFGGVTVFAGRKSLAALGDWLGCGTALKFFSST